MKRTVSLILAALILASSLLSCSEKQQDSGETADTAAKSAETAAETETEENLTDYELRQRIPDNLPEANYGGADFCVLTDEDGYSGRVVKRTEIIAEELTGDACNDAVYNRNLLIEDRFGVKISCATQPEPHTYINTVVTAGSDEYKLVSFYDYRAHYPISAQSLLNWKEAPYVDLKQPWHNALANDSATIHDKLYAVCSDLGISSMTFTYAIFFNITMAEDYGHTSAEFYDLVKSGEWTIDKFIELTGSIYADTNGNGKKDPKDTYGFGYETTNPTDVWQAAFDQPICTIDENGDLALSFMTEKTVAIVEKLVDWHYNTEGFYKCPTQYDEERYFLNNQLVFAPLRFYTAYNTLRDMENPYSILPYPKWNTEQEQYLTNADDKFTVFGLPLTVYDNLEFVSVIYEALCAESYKKVYPEYYDTALKGKYSEEPETAEMIDLIMEGRAFDFSFQFGNSVFQDLPYMIRERIRNKDVNVASAYNKIQKAINKQIEKTIDKLYPAV